MKIKKYIKLIILLYFLGYLASTMDAEIWWIFKEFKILPNLVVD